MSQNGINNLVQMWIKCKQDEVKAVEARRDIEDDLLKLLDIDPSKEGTINVEADQYKIKIITRLTRKVDADKLQEIAAEHDLNQELSTLFRWKADIDIKSWKSAPSEVTAVLSQAVTTTAGRPSFSINKEEI